MPETAMNPLDQLARRPLLKAEEERALAVRLAGGDASARDELVTRNLRLAYSQARKFRCRGLDDEDLAQWAIAGLLEATVDFDPDKGRFSTHATWKVRKYLKAKVVDEGSIVRVPRYAYYERAALARGEDLDEAATVRAALASRALSIRAYGMPDPDGLGIDHLAAAPDCGDPDDQVDAGMLADLLPHLPAREAEVIRRRFGLDGHREQTLEQIGLVLGVSKERVRQIEGRALVRLRGISDRARRPTLRIARDGRPWSPDNFRPEPTPATASPPGIEEAMIATAGAETAMDEPQAGGRSKYRGLTWNAERQAWTVYVWADGKNRFVGTYSAEREEVAAREYDRAAKSWLGVDAKLNFPADHAPGGEVPASTGPSETPVPAANRGGRPRKPRPAADPASADPIPPANPFDGEVAAIAAVAAALDGLGPDATRRVLDWAEARFSRKEAAGA